MNGETAGSPATMNTLRQGSVLDVLCPQTKTVTLDKPAPVIGMFCCLLHIPVILIQPFHDALHLQM